MIALICGTVFGRGAVSAPMKCQPLQIPDLARTLSDIVAPDLRSSPSILVALSQLTESFRPAKYTLESQTAPKLDAVYMVSTMAWLIRRPS